MEKRKIEDNSEDWRTQRDLNSTHEINSLAFRRKAVSEPGWKDEKKKMKEMYKIQNVGQLRKTVEKKNTQVHLSKNKEKNDLRILAKYEMAEKVQIVSLVN